MRFEEPSSMVRWDSPLFTVSWDEDDIPAEGIWQAIIKGDLKPANAGTAAVSMLFIYSQTVIDRTAGISCPHECVTDTGEYNCHYGLNNYDGASLNRGRGG